MTHSLMAEQTPNQTEPTRRERFPRREYYRGDADAPAQYHVLRCTNSHGHQAPLGMHDRRHGCGTHFVNYTAKHWGHSAVRWQSTCPSCGRKQQRNRGHILSTHDDREKAMKDAEWHNGQAHQATLKARINRIYVADGYFSWELWEEYIGVFHSEWTDEELKQMAEYAHEMVEATAEDFAPHLEEYHAFFATKEALKDEIEAAGGSEAWLAEVME